MFDILNQGGTTMYLILACSIGALAVVIERVVSLVRLSRSDDAFSGSLAKAVAGGDIDRAAKLCDSGDSPSARVCGAVLSRRGSPRSEVREAAQDAGSRELEGLSRYMGVLSTIAHVAPLLGLLGTVIGMLETFARIEAQAGGLVDPGLLSGGIRKALLTTIFGLAVAIPAFVAHAGLSAWINRIMGRTERIASAAVDMIGSPPGGAGGGGST